MFTPIKDSLSFIYFLKGAAFLLKNKKLFKYAIFQITIATILLVIAFFFIFSNGMAWYDSMLGSWVAENSAWYLITLYYTFVLPFFLIVTILSLFLIMILSAVINAPFNTLLSEKVEEAYTGKKFKSPLSFFGQIKHDVLYELRKLLFFIILLIIPLPLLLIPIIGGISYTIISAIILMYTLTFDFLDYPMERDMLDLKHRRIMIFKRPGIWIGYGGIMFGIFLIPLLNILVWPILITSGTLLYIDKLKIDKDIVET
ncbi:MAG: EI24 domain-containing protein [Candidatus Delongbacteria bacterium]|jgi:CysZ protein|nr:EI24 domain-containing protein [Candidatus Delongbacteria bacterium]